MDERQSLLHPHHGEMEPDSVYFGGCARTVETSLGLSGDEILYVGDHLFGDVHFSKALLRWRTALILRELESEISAAIEFRPTEERLVALMAEKEALEGELARLRLSDQRARAGYAAIGGEPPSPEVLAAARDRLATLDEEIAPLARAAGELRNATWGPLMRAGADKSLFARQVERYADVYTSRVANLLYTGPYAFLRAGRVDLPHDAVARGVAPTPAPG